MLRSWRPRNRSSIPRESTICSLLRNTQTGTGTDPASHSMGSGGTYLGVKSAGAWSFPLTSIKYRDLKWPELYLYSRCGFMYVRQQLHYVYNTKPPRKRGTRRGKSVKWGKVRKQGLFLSPVPGSHLALDVQDNFQRVQILVRETAQTHPSNVEGNNESRFYIHSFINFF